MQEGAQISEGQNYGKDRTTASLLQGAQVVVPRDSGPAHLAAAVDTPPGVNGVILVSSSLTFINIYARFRTIEFEYDPGKSCKNEEKHGIDFNQRSKKPPK